MQKKLKLYIEIQRGISAKVYTQSVFRYVDDACMLDQLLYDFFLISAMWNTQKNETGTRKRRDEYNFIYILYICCL